MADENPKHPDATKAETDVEREDLEDEASVLDRLVTHWPTHLQESDIAREMGLDYKDFGGRDRIDRAVVQLYWGGLALCCGEVVIPTRAALHYHRLSDRTTIEL
jgi:hypothetical protein